MEQIPKQSYIIYQEVYEIGLIFTSGSAIVGSEIDPITTEIIVAEIICVNDDEIGPVSYTHLTLPTTPYV